MTLGTIDFQTLDWRHKRQHTICFSFFVRRKKLGWIFLFTEGGSRWRWWTAISQRGAKSLKSVLLCNKGCHRRLLCLLRSCCPRTHCSIEMRCVAGVGWELSFHETRWFLRASFDLIFSGKIKKTAVSVNVFALQNLIPVYLVLDRPADVRVRGAVFRAKLADAAKAETRKILQIKQKALLNFNTEADRLVSLRFALWGWTVILLTMPCFHSMMQNNATKENPSNWFYVVASFETEIKFWNWNQRWNWHRFKIAKYWETVNDVINATKQPTQSLHKIKPEATEPDEYGKKQDDKVD